MAKIDFIERIREKTNKIESLRDIFFLKHKTVNKIIKTNKAKFSTKTTLQRENSNINKIAETYLLNF